MFVIPGHVACLHLKGGVGSVGYTTDGKATSASAVELPLLPSSGGAALTMDAVMIK